MPEVILASSSPYRKKQLTDFGLNVTSIAPTADESEIRAEDFSPLEVAQKRAALKTRSIAKKHPETIVIGGDQLAHLQGEILGKPGSIEKAVNQLLRLSGAEHELITACEVHFAGQVFQHTDITKLTMHSLSRDEAQRYVELDHPIDCAGAYKIEKHGLWLMDKIITEDHTAITGLPLLFVGRVLRQLEKGINLSNGK